MKILKIPYQKKLPGTIFLVILFACQTSFGKSWFVSQSKGNDQILNSRQTPTSSIGRAINMAMDGDTIYISTGLYDNDLKIINKSVVILGPQAGYIPKTLENRPGGECVILNSLNPSLNILINAPNVVIDGLKFGNGESGVISGLYINASKVLITNCIFQETMQNGIYISGQGKNAMITSNRIDGSEYEGILASAENVTIANNYVSNNKEFSSITVTQKTKIMGNVIYNSPNYGIEVIGDQSLLSLISDNKIENTFHQNIFIPENTRLSSNETKSKTAIVKLNAPKLGIKKIVNSELSVKNNTPFLDNSYQIEVKSQGLPNTLRNANTIEIKKLNKKSAVNNNIILIENICNGL